MPLTKVRRGGTDTGISDASDATAITIDSSESVGIKNTAPGNYLDGELTVGDSSKDQYINVVTGSGNAAGVMFQDTTGTSIVGGVRYTHSNNNLQLWANGAENLRLTNSVTGSGYTADSGTSLQSHPIMAIRASGQSRTDSYYDFTVDNNGGLYIICGFSHDQSPSTYGKFANFQVGHNATYITVNTLNAYGGNGSIGISKTSSTNLRVTFNKNESSGSGSYGTIEFVAVLGANPF